MAEELCALEKSGGGSGGTVAFENVGYIHINSTANQTITMSKAYRYIIVAKAIATSQNTLTISNNKSLTPILTASNASNILQVYENVPSGTIFTARASSAYWYDVAIFGIE